MPKQILLTGDRPTGPLHIGHLFGSLLNRKKLQGEYESYIMIADIQALTDNFNNPEKVRDNVFEVVADNMATGIDPKKTTIFIQSQIPQISELTVLFSNLITINMLKRNPTVKAEIAQKKDLFGQNGESVTYGFLGYPISQAADIAFLRANVVPVGQDQLPMVELTREIIEKFHRIYKNEIFPFPQAKLSPAPKILGLDGNTKMSKSLNNAIFLSDSSEVIKAKIKIATTDSESKLDYNPEKRPGLSNLVLIYSLIHNIEPENAVKKLDNISYSEFKDKLAKNLSEYLTPIREKREEIISNPKYLKEVLEDGRKKALTRAEETMALVRKAIKINY